MFFWFGCEDPEDDKNKKDDDNEKDPFQKSYIKALEGYGARRTSFSYLDG